MKCRNYSLAKREICCTESLNRTILCLKLLTSLVNILISLLGFGLILIVGFVYFYQPAYHFIVAINQLVSVPLFTSILVVMCVGLVVSGSYGFFHSVRENSYVINMQTILLSIFWIVLLILIGTSIYGYHIYIDYGLTFAVNMYNPKSPSSQYMEVIEKHLQCCGNLGPKDYNNRDLFDSNTVPFSCCDYYHKNRTTVKNLCKFFEVNYKRIPIELAFQTGCLEKFHDVIFPAMIVISSSLLLSILTNIIINIVYCAVLAYKNKKIIQIKKRLKPIFVGEISEDFLDASIELGLIEIPNEFESTEQPEKPVNLIYQCSDYKS